MARSADADAEGYEQLKRAVSQVGLIRRGSLVTRLVPCGRPGCRCQADPPQLHGPYQQWTTKTRGRTVTVRVHPEQARLLREWIANGRKLNQIVAEMQRVCLRLTDRLLRAAHDVEKATVSRARPPRAHGSRTASKRPSCRMRTPK